jgi:uncharacterized protein HemX
MTRQDEEDDTPATGPGPVIRFVLRSIDFFLRIVEACLHALQRLRNRFAPDDGEAERSDKRGQAPAEAEAPPRPASFLRRALVVLICLLLGAGVSALLVYRGLSLKLAEHAGVVDRMQEDIDAAKKEEARNVKLLDKFQRENAEYRHQAREAERQAENDKRRADELDAQMADLKQRAETPAPTRRVTTPTAPRSSTPRKTGNCAVGSADELSTCIEKFNR